MLNATDWSAPPGVTTIDYDLRDANGQLYGQITIGEFGDSTVNLTSGGVIETHDNNFRIGRASHGTVNVYDGARIEAHSIFLSAFLGSGSQGALNVYEGGIVNSADVICLGFDGSRCFMTVSGERARVETGRVEVIWDSEMTITDSAELFSTSRVWIDHASIKVSNGGYLECAGSLDLTFSPSITLNGGNVHVEQGIQVSSDAQFTFGVSRANGSGKITLGSSCNVSNFLSAGLTISSNEVFEVGNRLTILEGQAVNNPWGDSVTATNGQVFNIEYNCGPGLETQIVATEFIPEPSTSALLGGVGAVALAAGVRWRRRRRG